MGNTIAQAQLIDGKIEGNDVVEATHITPAIQVIEEYNQKQEAKKKKADDLANARLQAIQKNKERTKKHEQWVKDEKTKRRVILTKQLAKQYYKHLLDLIMVKVNEAYVKKDDKASFVVDYKIIQSITQISDRLYNYTGFSKKYYPNLKTHKYNVLDFDHVERQTPFPYDYKLFEKVIVKNCAKHLEKKTFNVITREIHIPNKDGVHSHKKHNITIYWNESLYKEENA